jgi:hypothetical protein
VALRLSSVDRGGGERHVHLPVQLLLKPATIAATSGSGVTVAVSTTRNCGHHSTLAPVALLLGLDVQVDHRDVLRVVGRLDHQRRGRRTR